MIPGDFQFSKPRRRKLVLVGIMGAAGLLGLAATAVVLTFVLSSWFDRPVFGFDEGPDQPIAFPHTVHAGTAILLDDSGNPRLDDQGQPLGGLGLDCAFCHRNVTEGAAATIPAVGLCLTCHKTVGDGLTEVEKLRAEFEAGRAIDWVRVHRVPDHVHFVHEAHIFRFSGVRTVVENVTDSQTHIRLDAAQVVKPNARLGDTLEIAASATCTICHGDVGGMIKVSQVRTLKMADCVDCHRSNNGPTDCTTCHY